MDNQIWNDDAPLLKNGFYGSYEHSVDAKGRVIIPNPYRRLLGENFTLTVGLDDRAICIYPDNVFEKLVGELFRLNSHNPLVLKQRDHIAKFSFPGTQTDGQGRVLLPMKLRKYTLGDIKDVEISGAIDHIRILGLDAGEAEDNDYKEKRDTITGEIGHLED